MSARQGLQIRNPMPVRHFSEEESKIEPKNDKDFGRRLHILLSSACVLNIPNNARMILESGLNPLNRTYTSDLWYNYIHAAAQEGSFEVVTILIEAGVPADTLDSQGKTAIQLAICNHHIRVVEFLLSKGADVNRKDGRGSAGLFYACCGWNPITDEFQIPSIAIVKILIDAGADVYEEGETNVGKRTPKQVLKQAAETIPELTAACNVIVVMLDAAMTFKMKGTTTHRPNELNCSICHGCSEDKNWCRMPCCSNSFHIGCIKHWHSSTSKKCPLCRAPTRSALRVV